MADAEFTSLLDMTCTVQRRSTVSLNTRGEEEAVWSNVATEVPCAPADRAQFNRVVATQHVHQPGQFNLTETLFMFEPEVDLQMSDRLTTLKDVEGALVLPVGTVFSTTLVARPVVDGLAHHVEANTTAIKDPN